MSAARVISLDDWRARRRWPVEDPPPAPVLRLVGADEPSAQVFSLEVFLERARVVMSEHQGDLASA
jgi:hypothetical protein